MAKKKIKKWSEDKYPKGVIVKKNKGVIVKKNDDVVISRLMGEEPKRYYLSYETLEPYFERFVRVGDVFSVLQVMYCAKNMAEGTLDIADGEYYDLCVGCCYGDECIFRFCTRKSGEETCDFLDDIFVNKRYFKEHYGMNGEDIVKMVIYFGAEMLKRYNAYNMNQYMYI